MTILAALLLFSATGSARAEMTVDDSIAGIILKTGEGAFNEFTSGTKRLADPLGWMAGVARRVDSAGLQLRIDGEPREGFRAWGNAAWRVAGYVTDLRDDGAVGYEYRLRVRGYDVRRQTRIENGQVLLTTTADWVEVIRIPLPKFLQRLLKKREIIRRVPVHVQLVIHATERRGNTLLVGEFSGSADTADFRCRRVRFKHAEPESAAALDFGLSTALDRIRDEGTRFYRTGAADIGDTLDQIRPALQAALKVRLLRR